MFANLKNICKKLLKNLFKYPGSSLQNLRKKNVLKTKWRHLLKYPGSSLPYREDPAREWRGEENISLLYRARLLLLNSRIWGFLHLLLESRFLSLSLTLFLSFCQKNCVLRVWHSVLWRCYQFRFFWPMVIFWQTILLRFYALLLFWNHDRIMMTEKTHK